MGMLEDMAKAAYKKMTPSDKKMSELMNREGIKQYHEMYPNAPQFKPENQKKKK